VRRARRFACPALAACLLALAASAQAAQRSPGSETFGREFCVPAPIAAGDPGPEVGLAVERTNVHTGGAAFARVENRSDEEIAFGVEYRVQRFAGGTWRRAPGAPHGPWIQIAVMLPAGRSGSCVRYVVPDNAPPGRYRFSRDLIAGSSSARPYSVPFRVLP